MGPDASPPTVVQWHWYYHLPGFAGWALIAALLVLVKENRNGSAWLVLIPFLALGEVVWPWVVQLLSVPSAIVNQIELPYQSFLVAWTALWLLGPWLARRRPALALLLSLALVAAVTIVAEVGVTLADPYLYAHLYPIWFMRDVIYIMPLPVAFALSAACCRRSYTPRRFMIWLAFWLIAAVFSGAVLQTLYHDLSRLRGLAGPPVLAQLPQMLLGSAYVAAVLYLLNLPYMYLAFRCAMYRDRFRAALRLQG